MAGGGRTGRLWPALRDRLTRLDFRFDHVETRAPGEATVLSEEAVRRAAALRMKPPRAVTLTSRWRRRPRRGPGR
ncbi:MAG: hypothetical protein HY953_01850 [Candidatus Rokubacteria bacterium]|nr:hypothetical protein [Candidatus Rokubacteria bacterium]